MSAGLGGWQAFVRDAPILLVFLTGVGGAAVAFVVVKGIFWFWRWLFVRQVPAPQLPAVSQSTNEPKLLLNRPQLTEEFGTLPKRLATVSWADAIFVAGVTFYTNNDENREVIKRLILPHPDNVSLEYFHKTINEENPSAAIKSTTRKAQRAGALVKWCDHFIFCSVVLADTETPSGWVQVEPALPTVVADQRQSYVLQNLHHPREVKRAKEMFERLWRDSADAPK